MSSIEGAAMVIEAEIKTVVGSDVYDRLSEHWLEGETIPVLGQRMRIFMRTLMNSEKGQVIAIFRLRTAVELQGRMTQ